MIANLQRFKDNDETEAKVIAVAMPTITALGTARDAFYDGANTAYGLGEVLWDLDRDPMKDALSRETYRRAFPAIHQLFKRPGTFEFYLTVFRAIWGDAVAITFAVPSPGVLTINASVLDFEKFDLVARQIVGNNYTYPEVVDHSGNNIAVVDTIGIKTQAEIQALMNEISPEGIFVTTTLTI